jgi:hypothetical protein
MEDKQVFYRAEMNYFYTGRLSTPKIVIDVDEYFELSRTPCGVWLDCSPRKPRWINLSARCSFKIQGRKERTTSNKQSININNYENII